MQKDESQISRQARWQRKHRAMGLCVLCSRPAFKGWRCKKHYEQHKITMRLRYIPKVRGRYKVSGSSAEGASKSKTTKKASKPAKKSASRTATRPTARKATKTTKTARKPVARKTTARRAAPKKAAKG